jgi:hypothetical protein
LTAVLCHAATVSLLCHADGIGGCGAAGGDGGGLREDAEEDDEDWGV